ncbi:MAG TPA: ABC transporter substrate-binding protein, partial [Allosphingosinicella sp.]
MVTRFLPAPRLLAATLLLAGCGGEETGPISISAIGGQPRIANPSRDRLDPPSAILIEAAAQGLVRFDAGGEIEPALAQRWIVSDDGLRYTFRLGEASWGGRRITAEQVVARLRAAVAPASRNPLKPVLGAVDEIVAMTDDVLEISLKSPRPNFLQLLAQPEMAIVRGSEGSGPYRAERR